MRTKTEGDSSTTNGATPFMPSYFSLRLGNGVKHICNRAPIIFCIGCSRCKHWHTPPPTAQPNNFLFCFSCLLALLYTCFCSIVSHLLWYEMAYISSRLEIISLIMDRFFFNFFFNSLFLVPPSMMRVVFLACSRYYHQLWILSLG